jgi:hypothetical protein
MSLNIPVPVTFVEWLWFAMGVNFGRGFGKQLDQTIQSTDWFKRRGRFVQWFVRRVLDVTHHWWIGGLLMAYSGSVELFWFGAGLFVDDLPDIPRRAKELLKEFKK